MASEHSPPRPQVCGAASPETPFPIYLHGAVEHGFGRGSKDLNCPTANLPVSSLEAEQAQGRLERTGVYFGYAQVYPMVMSVGWNPHFKNTEKSVEVHILHGFHSDFYGKDMRVIVLGYIRPELEYKSLDALIDDIETDKHVGRNSVARPAYEAFQRDAFFA